MSIMNKSRNVLGEWGERCAERYLKDHGYEILARNWRSRGGEVDLVVRDESRQALVAVEVKTRRTSIVGSPEAAVTAAKLARLRTLLLQWIIETQTHAPNLAVDVVAVRVVNSDEYTIEHLKDVQ